MTKELLYSSIAASALLIAAPASAADIYDPPPMPTPAHIAAASAWSGFYVGASVGYGAGNADLVFNTRNEDGHFWDMGHRLGGGFIGGIQAGYDHQAGNILWGIVGDYNFTSFSGSFTNPGDGSNFIGVDPNGPIDGPPVHFETSLNGIVSLRGRVGKIFSLQTMGYLHGGLAWGNFTVTGEGGPANNFEDQQAWKAGFVGGVGVEHMLTGNVSLFAEYAYYNFGSADLFLITNNNDSYVGALRNMGRDVHALKVGVNARLGGGMSNAADDPMYAAAGWSGFYVGASAGYGTGNADLVFNTRNEDGHFWDMGQNLGGGFIGGLQAGYDHQVGNILWGIVGDYSFAGLHGAFANPQDESNFIGVEPAEEGPPVHFETTLNGVASLRARAGKLFTPQTMGYLHGGVAWGNFKVTGGGGPANNFEDQQAWKAGFVGGVGVEHKLTGNVSLFGEYAYYNFASPDLFLIANNNGNYVGALTNMGRDIHALKVGVNLRFP